MQRSLESNPTLPDGLRSLPDALRLARCQVDVSFPPGYKLGPQPHCPWYAECNGRPQIVEVKDTGWEIYHFPSVADAQRFAQLTRQRISEGAFAGGRMPTGAQVTIQVRVTIEMAEDISATTP